MQTYSFSDSFWGMLKSWYQRPSSMYDPDFDIDSETNGDCYEAYAQGVKDGKTELVKDIFEHLDLINLN